MHEQLCLKHFTLTFCISPFLVGNVCDANNCVNGAVCQPDPVDCTRYVCQCPPCFSGPSCEQSKEKFICIHFNDGYAFQVNYENKVEKTPCRYYFLLFVINEEVTSQIDLNDE